MHVHLLHKLKLHKNGLDGISQQLFQRVKLTNVRDNQRKATAHECYVEEDLTYQREINECALILNGIAGIPEGNLLLHRERLA